MELLFSISGLVNALASTILGTFVILKNKESKANQTFAFFCFCVAAWSYAYIFWPLAKDAEHTLFWFRVLHFGAIYVSVALLHFITVWLGIFQKNKKFIIFGYILSSFFALFAFSPLFIKEVVPKFSMRYWANPGILYHFYLIHFFSYALYALYLLVKAYKKSSGAKKMQARYILIGMIITYIAGSTNYFLWYDINIPPYLNILASVYVISIAYAIIRYRLMDIRIATRKSFIFITLSTFAYAVFYATAHTYRAIWGDVFATQGYIVGIFVALAFTALFFLVQKYSHKFVNNYLYANVYNTQKTLENLAGGLHNLIKLDEIIDSIVETIINAMELDKAGVLLLDIDTEKYKIAKTIGFNEHNGISRIHDNFLTRKLKETGEPLVLEELELMARDVKPQTKKNIEKVLNNMKHIEANCCLPMLMRGELTGMIVLGSKKNSEAYSEQDINLLKSVASQASIAISNAQLYNEMEKIVKSQTKELRTKNKDLKTLNKDLQETLEAKQNFLTVASHQLRTPTSVIKGMLDMLLDQSIPSEKKNDFIQRCSVQACHLSNTIHDLLSSTAIEGKGFELNRNLTNIDELIAKMVEEKKIQLEENNKKKERDVKLIYQPPKSPTPTLNIDSNKMGEVISNLIDNAIQYTLKGKIEITTKTDSKNFIFNIKDTGIGIEKQDMSKLFKKIARLPNAINICPDGTGLGLFIIKGMVEKHGGKVEVKSEGTNKGSEFSFWIPIG